MRIRLSIVLVLVFVHALMGVPSAIAGECSEEGSGAEDALTLEMDCSAPGVDMEFQSAGADSDYAPSYSQYMWHSPCISFDPTDSLAEAPDCGVARICSDPRERSWQLWGYEVESDRWRYLTSRCFGQRPTAADTPRPRITPALVLNEIRRIGLPKLQARTQPAGKTLVNFDTIFYTEAQPFSATVTLLGQQVDIVAEATQYTWRHGDGTSTSTASPGAPYPSKEITYRYSHAGKTVRPRVDVTYSARFRVNGGPWQNIDETVTIAGPETALRVSEAKAVLSGDYS